MGWIASRVCAAGASFFFLPYFLFARAASEGRTILKQLVFVIANRVRRKKRGLGHHAANLLAAEVRGSGDLQR